MKKFIKNFAYLLVATSIATMVSGCSLRSKTSDTTPKVFTIWSFETEDTWKPVIKDLQKQLSGYEIKYFQKKLDDSYENDALNSIMSGQGPDIWAIPNDWIYRHKDKLAAAPDSVVSQLKLDDKFVPAIKQSSMFDGKLYSLSPFVDSLTIFYNQKLIDQTIEEYDASHQTKPTQSEAEKEAVRAEKRRVTTLLSQPASTWTNFAEIVRLITKKDGNTVVRSGAALGTSTNIKKSVDILYAMMLQNGTEMTSDDLKLGTFSLPQNANTGLPDAPAKRAIDFYTSFSNPSSPNYSWSADMPNDIDALAQGKVAMIFSTNSLVAYYAQNYPNFKYKKSSLPQIGDNDTNVVDYGTFYSFVVPKLSNNTATAWSMVSALGQNQYGFADILRLPSSKKMTDTTPSLTARTGESNPGRIQAQTAKVWVKGRYPQAADTIFKSTIDKVNAEPANSQALLDTAAVNLTNLLKKSDW